jgi:hypothetical protein
VLKAELDLTNIQFVNYQHLDLEKDWRQIPVIRIWLKARSFDLTMPIFVTREENIMTFFQTKSDSGKTLVLVHPNPKILNQLHNSLKHAGHLVHAFKRVKDANVQIQSMIQSKTVIDKIVVPTNLKVSYNFTYKNYLNKKYPGYDVLTVDNKDYRETVSLKGI